MKGKRRAALTVLAASIALAMSFLVLPANGVRAQTTTTSSSSSGSSTSTTSSVGSTSTTTASSTTTTSHGTTTTTSAAQGCHSDFNGGTVSPGATVGGALTLNNGCKFTGDVSVTLNDAHMTKKADSSGGVSVSVKINSMTSGDLGDPVPVTLHAGTNTVVVSGAGQTRSGASAGTVTINATFNLQAPATTTTTRSTTPTVTPVNTQSTSSGGGGLAGTGVNLLAMVAVAFVALALGTHAIATRWTAPANMLAGVEEGRIESVLLTAASYILGPPPGRHSEKVGPRGLVPAVRDWLSRER